MLPSDRAESATLEILKATEVLGVHKGALRVMGSSRKYGHF